MLVGRSKRSLSTQSSSMTAGRGTEPLTDDVSVTARSTSMDRAGAYRWPMVDPAVTTDNAAGDAVPVDVPPAGDPPQRPGRRGTITLLAALAVVLIGGLAIGFARQVGPAPALPGASSAQVRSSPLVALIDRNGALATADGAGHARILAAEPGTVFGFPAWSADGSRLAAIAYGDTDTAISIFPVPAADGPSSQAPAPVVVYRSAAVPPFYLYWTPDGQHISFLATEADGISLRVAPADGSAPLDGAPGSIIRQGAPLYFDWIDTNRLLVHIGNGPAAFLGEVGLDGQPVAPALADSGDFRAPMIGGGGRFLAYVRGSPPAAQLVVAARDGSSEHTAAVSGPAAAVFDPTGTTVAVIATMDANQANLGFPFGPLRLIDAATGAARTLLDGTVVGFFWSPDGRTIAALRLQPGTGSTVADGGIIAAATGPTPSPSPGPELHLLFVNVADGAIRSDRIVRLTSHFVNEFLPYFDQYALSHRVWAPDSSSILLPLVDDAGRDQLVSLEPDGAPSTSVFDGTAGFWSP
jgi:TolB protein